MKIAGGTYSQAERGATVRVLDMADFSVHDGPGTSAVVYFQACSARCDWRHTPQSQSLHAPVIFNSNRCCLCWRCANACQQKVHAIEDGTHQINRASCVYCGRCIEACPNSISGVKGSALHLPVSEIPVNILFEQIAPYARLCGAKGGVFDDVVKDDVFDEQYPLWKSIESCPKKNGEKPPRSEPWPDTTAHRWAKCLT